MLYFIRCRVPFEEGAEYADVVAGNDCEAWLFLRDYFMRFAACGGFGDVDVTIEYS